MGFTFIVMGILVLLLVWAILLFIEDGIKAKNEGRKRNSWITAFFIIVISILCLIVIGGILLIGLTFAIVSSM